MQKGRLSSVKGFTLVELLVVIAIIGILAAGVLILINPLKQISRGRDAIRKNTLRQIQRALEDYYIVNGTYPTTVVDFDLYDLSQYTNGFLQALYDVGSLKAPIKDPKQTGVNNPCRPGYNGECYAFAYSSVPGWYGVGQNDYVLFVALENADDPMILTHSCINYRGNFDKPCVFLKPNN